MIVQDGLRRMFAEQEDVFYYLTLMNENYAAPGAAGGRARRGSCAGCTGSARPTARPRCSCSGSGTILREVLAGAELLRDDFGVEADVWSVTRFTELRRDGMEAERWNRLHPSEEPRACRTSRAALDGHDGPVVAATDYIRALPDQIRPWVAGPLPRARHRRLRAQRLPRARCAASSRSTATTSCVAALQALGDDDEAAREGDRRSTRSTPRRRPHGGR